MAPSVESSGLTRSHQTPSLNHGQAHDNDIDNDVYLAHDFSIFVFDISCWSNLSRLDKTSEYTKLNANYWFSHLYGRAVKQLKKFNLITVNYMLCD